MVRLLFLARLWRAGHYARPPTMNMLFARWTGGCEILRPSREKQRTAAVSNLLKGGSILFARHTTPTSARVRARMPPGEPAAGCQRARRVSGCRTTVHQPYHDNAKGWRQRSRATTASRRTASRTTASRGNAAAPQGDPECLAPHPGRPVERVRGLACLAGRPR
jgi:hypothetical protein